MKRNLKLNYNAGTATATERLHQVKWNCVVPSRMNCENSAPE